MYKKLKIFYFILLYRAKVIKEKNMASRSTSTASNRYFPVDQAHHLGADFVYCCNVDSANGSDEEFQEIEMTPTANSTSFKFDANDPLRYFMEIGEIDESEYEKWKIVKIPFQQVTRKSTTPPNPIDFGPGYNSDSDTDNEYSPRATDCDYNMIYGHGYVTQSPRRRIQQRGAFVPIDNWFPNPDPTPNKQYKEIAENHRVMMWQFVMFDIAAAPNNEDQQPSLSASIARLKPAFELKIIWERFTEIKEYHHFQTLQEFWQNNSLIIYEALQELVQIHARCFNPEMRILIPDSPEFHTTPLEMLENTYETIGRMSRCIAEEFNDQTIHAYIGEFIQALYVELRFMDLVEARVDIEMDTESEFHLQKEMMLNNND
jgi:hypothetical protein